MSTLVVDISERASHGDRIVFRLTLEKRRIYRVPQIPCRVRVLEGIAWVTFDDEDYLVWAGRSMDLEKSKYNALISALGDETLVFEVDSREPILYEHFMSGLARLTLPRRRGLAELARQAIPW